MKQITTYDSPLGISLADYEIQDKQLNPEKISLALRDNRIILITGYVPGRGMHMAHLAVGSDGGIVSASDGNIRVRLKQDEEYDLIELIKR